MEKGLTSEMPFGRGATVGSVVYVAPGQLERLGLLWGSLQGNFHITSVSWFERH